MCGMGNCASHNRIDVRELPTAEQDVYMVTYVGDFAVVTLNNPAWQDSAVLVQGFMDALSGVEPKLPDDFITGIIRVGSGTLSEANTKDAEVFSETHGSGSAPSIEEMDEMGDDVFQKVLDRRVKAAQESCNFAHDSAIDMVKSGMFV